MKTLTKHAVLVRNNKELNMALDFFRLASKRKLLTECARQYHTPPLLYVGLGGWRDENRSIRRVTAGCEPYSDETVIPFSQIKKLADTPSRMRAYKKVFGK